jgi:hypothetical protein
MNYAPSSSTLASVGLGVPIATVAAWAVGVCCNVPVPGEVQAAIGALISAVIGYFFVGGRHVDTTDEPPA